MKRQACWLLIFGAILVLAFGCAPVGKMTHDMDQWIKGAQTRADHEALAKHYEQEAKAAMEKAEQMRKMADTYNRTSGYAKIKGNLAVHCNAIAREYENAGREYLELANLHRQLAAEAQE